MTKAEEILDKHAKKHMFQWTLNAFKITYPRLYRSIIEAIDEALVTNAKTELCEHPQKQRDYYRENIYKCWNCLKIIVPDEYYN